MRASDVNSFGIDVSRDILKAVTGEPILGVEWRSIHGAGAQYSFTVNLQSLSELSIIAANLSKYYDLDTYKNGFEWVDNIQKVRNDTLIDALNGELIAALNGTSSFDLQLTLPHIVDWDRLAGFSFTNAKTKVKPILAAADYFAANPAVGHTLTKLKSNKVFCFDVDDNESNYPVYSCIYFECVYNGKLYILFSRDWFSVDQEFMSSIDAALKDVPLSTLSFPPVEIKSKAGGKGVKSTKTKATVEAEGEYNERVSSACGYHLMDKKLVKPRTGASAIELCDLLTNGLQFIHAKHRKGGSAGLSHLFAQGRIAAELLLSDQEFRKSAKSKLPHASRHLIDAVKFDSSKCEIIFLVLGDVPAQVKANLPFFSKVNLWLTYQNLVQRNFRVSLAAAPLAPSSPVTTTPIVVAPKSKQMSKGLLNSAVSTQP